MICREAGPLTLQAHHSRYPALREFLRVAYSSILGQIRSDKTVNSGGAASLAARLCSVLQSDLFIPPSYFLSELRSGFPILKFSYFRALMSLVFVNISINIKIALFFKEIRRPFDVLAFITWVGFHFLTCVKWAIV